MKDKIQLVLGGIIIFAIFFAYFCVMSIIDLNNKDDVYETKIDYATEFLVVEHSINLIIPTGKTYYYAGINDETDEIYIIKAKKSWYKKNFDSKGYAKGKGVSIKGLAEKEDYKVGKELDNRISKENIQEYMATKSGYALNIDYEKSAIIRLILGVVVILEIVVGLIMKKMKASDKAKLVLTGIGVVTFIAVMIHIFSIQ